MRATALLVGVALAYAGPARADPRIVVADAPGQEPLVAEVLLALRIVLPELPVERDDGAAALARVAVARLPGAVRVRVESPWSGLAVERPVVVGDAAPAEVAAAIALVVRSLLSLALLDVPERTVQSPPLARLAAPRAARVARRLAPELRAARPGPLRLATGAILVIGRLPLENARPGARVSVGAVGALGPVPLEASLDIELLAPVAIDRGREAHLVYRGFPIGAWAGVPFALGRFEVTPALGFVVERSSVEGTVTGRTEPLAFADWNTAVAVRGRVRLHIAGRLWADAGLRLAWPFASQHYRLHRQSFLDTPGLALATDAGIAAELP